MLPSFSLGRYLGIFFITLLCSKADFAHMVHKTNQRINLWEYSFLSQAGKFTLIQSNLEALPSYTFVLTMLSLNIAKSINTLHRKIFLRQNNDKNATPKSQGGLGLRKTLPMNIAL